jgi:S1-C subfamily serine protease
VTRVRLQVVGINSMTMANAEGISFAIPIDTAKLVAKQLVTNGRVGRPYIGIRMLTLTPTVVQQLRARNFKVGDSAAGNCPEMLFCFFECSSALGSRCLQ